MAAPSLPVQSPSVVRARARALTTALSDRGFSIVTIGTVALIVGVPVAFMVVSSFRGPGTVLPLAPAAEWTGENYAEVVSTTLVSTAGDTLVFVLGSLVVAVGFGLPLAYLLERTDLPGRRLLLLFLFAPLLLAPITNAQAWSVLISPETGLLNQVLRLVLPVERGPLDTQSALGMVLAQGFTYVPMVALFLGPALANVDAPLEEASRTSGAGPLTTFRRVTLKLLAPAILSVTLLLAVFLLGQFEIPLVFGIGSGLQPLGIVIFSLLNPPASVPSYGQIAAYSTLMTTVSYALILGYGFLTRRGDRFATVTGKGHRANLTSLGTWRWPAFIAVAGFLLLTAGMRLFVIVWQSLLPFRGPVSWEAFTEQASLDAYRRVIGDSRFLEAVQVTAIVSIGSAVITTLIGLAMAWVVARSGSGRIRRRALDLLASSSLAVPSPVAAFAFLLLFLALNQFLPLYGSMFALMVAYCFRVGVAYRMSSAALLQIGSQLEEASALSGGSPLTTFRRVVLPLLAPTIVVLLVLGLVTGINEFTVPLFLSSQGPQPLSVYTYGLLSNQQQSAAAAAGVLTLVTVLVMAAAAAWAGRRLRGSSR
ncbi:MAG: iron ABC transporter permease [Acidimicrobiia bacterium]|nr:iron ABC transporter permease [Acidimicrobiia bacterium]